MCKLVDVSTESELTSDEYLTIKDVSKKLHIKYNKARLLFHVKGFPGIKLGGTFVVKEKDLVEYLDKHRGSEIAI